MTVTHSFFCRARDIAAVSLDADRGSQVFGVKNFVMNEPGGWKYFELPNMIFEQVKDRTKRPWWKQTLLFDIPTKTDWEALKEYEICCDLVAAHYMDDMERYLIQGIEPELTETSHYVSSKYLSPRMILPMIFDSERPMQGRFESGAEILSSFCFLSKKQFENL